jgi:hypothetical protein
MKIVIDMPKEDVHALLVAISNHAHRFLMDAQQDRKRAEMLRKLNRTPARQAVITQCEEDAAEWQRKGDLLNAVKADIKRQARIK